MKRFLIFFLLMVCGFAYSNAQETESFYFYNDVFNATNKKVDQFKVKSHYLGEEIALKMYLFKDMYTVVEPATDVNPVEKTIVNKPSIFYSIKKLNSFYKKSIKKGLLSEQDARDKMNTYLNICLSIYVQDTESFEGVLKTAKNQTDIDNVFSRVVLED